MAAILVQLEPLGRHPEAKEGSPHLRWVHFRRYTRRAAHHADRAGQDRRPSQTITPWLGLVLSLSPAAEEAPCRGRSRQIVKY